MATYFARRLVGGVVTWLLATFVLFTLVVYVPGGAADQGQSTICTLGNTRTVSDYLLTVVKTYALDSPWPVSYLRWMFDPQDTARLDEQDLVVNKGVDFEVPGVSVKGSGVLTGDFDESFQVRKHTPALDYYGVDFGLLLAGSVELVGQLMVIALLQRKDMKPLRTIRVEDARARYGVERVRVVA